MDFRGICIETANVKKMSEFYSMALKMEAHGNEVHSEFPEAKLAIYNPIVGENREVPSIEDQSKCFVMMFEVEDADTEYTRLKGNGTKIISEPQTKPWGARAFSFADPDGNRVNFLSVPKK